MSDLRRGKNTRHLLTGLLRQSVFGRLAGYEDVNDAERLSRDPAMRAIVDRKGLDRRAASTSQMGRFETEWLATDDNLAALTALSGVWIDRMHDRRPPKMIALDMDSSVSPTHGEQEGTAYNGHFGCACYHPLLSAWSKTAASRSTVTPSLSSTRAGMLSSHQAQQDLGRDPRAGDLYVFRGLTIISWPRPDADCRKLAVMITVTPTSCSLTLVQIVNKYGQQLLLWEVT